MISGLPILKDMKIEIVGLGIKRDSLHATQDPVERVIMNTPNQEDRMNVIKGMDIEEKGGVVEVLAITNPITNNLPLLSHHNSMNRGITDITNHHH